ncbi:GH3 auxin-responsive promoter family protein [Carboxylicivirga mesophila]|uniref:GH3 auxin-responsive promoter family protein n=1 Tax=Carboxylicivirga mesophila TaxID=1166478 RepID=A0ABS5KFE5_9BACT|nr:GH3 auxin-responsive promoter family protein [Carboxylicivirga mesophila]MBS2213701.1 GH3 auxin-responsive promoter family protein [Carboxylicivirga mesophila]
MPILSSIISLVNARRLSQIDHFKKNPEEVQQAELRRLLDSAKHTTIGKEFEFKSIAGYGTFAERVPVQDYEGLRPYVERLREGESNLLWPGDIKWFAKSSGTTSTKSKFIPVTKETLEDCHFRGGKDVLALYLQNNPDSDMFSGKCLTLGGSHQINNFSNESYYGDLSAILIENLPFWTHFARTPEQSIALMDEWEAKLEKITETTIKDNVTSLAGVPSWFLVLIKHLLKQTGKSNLLEIWPNLELFMHGGINFTPYRKQYKELIPTDKMNYLETYNASEGFFGIQDDLNDPGMLLMLDYGVFYEFIPLNQITSPHPDARTIEDVEIGVDYAMVITTNSGLWRYMIGDTVRFTSLRPHKIIITGRTKHYINAFGEELMIENAERALEKACAATNAVIKEYTAAPVFMGEETKGAHEWLIEFDTMPVSLENFTELLDKTLQEVNSDYEAKRYKNITLEGPKVTVARHHLFMDWLKSKNKLGGQNKIPRLANNREYIDELLKLNH